MMAKTCQELFAKTDATIIGDANIEVTGIAYRSDQVREGDAFFCVVGFKTDGHTFAQDAIDRGASVIVAERNLYLADATEVTVVMVSDTRQAMAEASCAFYDYPSSSFDLVGITGTNGKTTTTYLVEEIARACGKKTGVIGTVGIKIGDEVAESGRTTPESPDLQRTFAKMRDAGCEVVAMEVSSHALDLKRVWGCQFAVTAFTNLTQDHLDYHQTFEAYFQAKALLFGADYPAKRVIGVNDDWGRRLAASCEEAEYDVVTFGYDESCSICPSNLDFKTDGTDFMLTACGHEYNIQSPLVGEFNVENDMCAFGCGIQLGFDGSRIAEALSGRCLVPGRLEHVLPDGLTSKERALLPAVYVDYAHTPDALEKAISSVSALGEGRTIVLFGCGGDRDREKRPIMGKASLAGDHVIITSDNPRSEDPATIIEDILSGISDDVPKEKYDVIADRADAIRHAIKIADSFDVILLAGKGHEDYQEISSGKVHFDDREQARDALLWRLANGSDDAGDDCATSGAFL